MRQVSQRLKDGAHAAAHPQRIRALLNSIARDGAGDEGGGSGSLEMLRAHSRDELLIRLKRQWKDLATLAEKRRAAGACLLLHLLAKVAANERGKDLLVETTQGALMAALKADVVLRSLPVENWSRLLDRGLLWLHEQEIIRLNRGLTVFRSAMTLHLSEGSGWFKQPDYKPLRFHYDEQTFQVHVMLEYAEKGIAAIVDALKLVAGYFSLGKEEFVEQYFAGRKADLKRQATPESWVSIVESLGNKAQKHIVADDRENKNVLVLAGPGSGKTRVLVHRLAYLIRCRRENPDGIIALSYNRHTAADIRKRLWQLIGADAAGVTIMTCHAIAMRLVGASFVGLRGRASEADFDAVIDEAIRLLEGGRASVEQAQDARERRDRLLAGYRWLPADEYQDIDSRQYALVSALAGRSINDAEQQLNLLAVGDDDQNIYSWNGASVEFIQKFQSDYSAQSAYLTENYRSTRHIIEASNQIIQPARARMKQDQEIRIDRARRKDKPGGRWQELDARVARGRVQLIACEAGKLQQAHSVMSELLRLQSLDDHWDWSRVAVIARQWQTLNPLRAWCELKRIPVQLAREGSFSIWSLRETQVLVSWLLRKERALIGAAELEAWVREAPAGCWWEILKTGLSEYMEECSGAQLPPSHLLEWLAEYCRDIRRQQQGLLLTTAHGAKGLEFDQVAILDGGWNERSAREDPDASRRLFYVAMTRASQGLLIAAPERSSNPFLAELRSGEHVLERSLTGVGPAPPDIGCTYQSLSTGDVDLSFSGRFSPGHSVHKAISELQAGDSVGLSQREGRCYVVDTHGRAVSRMAKRYVAPAGQQFAHGRVAAVLRRSRDQADPDWIHTLKSDEWEVVVPELVFSPV